MTALYFNVVALPKLENGLTPVHMYIEEAKPTWTDSPREERCAVKDLEHVIRDIVRENVDGTEDALLREGEMPIDGEPVVSFGIACQYDGKTKMAHYKQLDLVWISRDRKFAKVPGVARELSDYTICVLRAREKKEMAEKGVKSFRFDAVSLKKCREDYAEFCATVADRQKRRRFVRDANARRFGCEFLRNGYCTPIHSDCPCFVNGKCVEVK